MEEIKRALPYLRKVYGEKWFTRVSAIRLNMASPSCCVLGQLNVGKKYPFMAGLQAIAEAGLQTPRGVFANYDVAWKELLRDLQKKERKVSKT